MEYNAIFVQERENSKRHEIRREKTVKRHEIRREKTVKGMRSGERKQ